MKTFPPRLQDWLDGPLGQALLAAERAQAEEALERVFGVQCVQVGAWGAEDLFLAHARTQRRALLAAHGCAGAAVRAHDDALPLQSDSVDALILPHTLEFAEDPHGVLREAERVLTGEGTVVILGFEPLGAWAVRHRLSRGGFPPHLERVLPERRVADWLKLLGFEVAPPRRFLYTLPLRRLQRGRAKDWMERGGRLLWPRLSAAYLLVARKHVYSMTPIRRRYRPQPAVIAGGLAQPSRRVGT
jgi:SAM-dependent methyltransferase